MYLSALKLRPGNIVRLLLLVLILVAAGCSTAEDDPPAPTDAAAAEQEITETDAKNDFTIYLSGAVQDTLRGRAAFGDVVISGTQKPFTLIDLRAGGDFTGGFFIVFDSTGLPPVGEVDFAAATDSAEATGGTRIVYRRGLLVDLRSRSGSVTFTQVSDTLIAGEIDAALYGVEYEEGTEMPGVELRARGAFRAHPGNVGYILGL